MIKNEELTNEEKAFLVRFLSQVQIKISDPQAVIFCTLAESCLKKLSVLETKIENKEKSK